MKRQIDTKACPTEKLPNPRSESPGSVTVPKASRLNAETDPQLRLSQHSAHIPIRATLVGSDRCEALGITGCGYTPLLALCRALVAAGHDPRRPLHAYRGDVLVLNVRSIGEAGKLSVREDRTGPRFVPWEPFPRGVKPRTREKAKRVATAHDQDNEPSARPGATTPVPGSSRTQLNWSGTAGRRG
jgi:hypothetical protein